MSKSCCHFDKLSVDRSNVGLSLSITMTCRRRISKKRLSLYAFLIFTLYPWIATFALDIVVFNLAPQLPLITSQTQRLAFQNSVIDAQKKYQGILNITVYDIYGYPNGTCQDQEDIIPAMTAEYYYQHQRKPRSCYAVVAEGT